jgi:hypothetical protein
MKKLGLFFLCMVLCLSLLSVSALAAAPQVNYGSGSGEYWVMMEAGPFIEDGRTFLPVRYVAEAFGIFTTWDSYAGTVTLERGLTTVHLTIGSNILKRVTNGIESLVEMDVAPLLHNGRTCLPIRFVAEAFGLDVEWIADWNMFQQAAIITDGFKRAYLFIGDNVLFIAPGHFLRFYETDSLRFAYPVLPDRLDSADPYPNIPATEFIESSESLIAIRVPPNVWGGLGCTITVTFEPVDDRELESVINNIALQVHEELNHEYTAISGVPAIAYTFYIVYPAARAVSGAAFFHADMLIRFEVSVDMENISVSNLIEWGIAYATMWLGEMLPALTLR